MTPADSAPRGGEYHYPLSHHETHLWAFQLHTMLAAGIALVTSLETLARSELPSLANASQQLIDKLVAGMSLSQAMVSLRPTFSPLAINLVSIGEQSGKLVAVLERLSTRAARRDRMERSLKSALAYPMFLSAVSLSMALFMAFYMFPKMLPFLTGLGVGLPWPTRLLIWGVENLSSAVLIVTILLVGMFRLLASRHDATVSGFRDRLLFNSPVLGRLNRNRVYADAFGDLHLLLEAGCDLLLSLKVIHSSWPDFEQRKAQCLEALRAGASFPEAVDKSRLFPRIFLLQLASADEMGKLPRSFAMISDQLDEMIAMKVSQLVQILEPCLFMVMGLVTGFVVLATFLPMYGVVTSSL